MSFLSSSTKVIQKGQSKETALVLLFMRNPIARRLVSTRSWFPSDQQRAFTNYSCKKHQPFFSTLPILFCQLIYNIIKIFSI